MADRVNCAVVGRGSLPGGVIVIHDVNGRFRRVADERIVSADRTPLVPAKNGLYCSDRWAEPSGRGSGSQLSDRSSENSTDQLPERDRPSCPERNRHLRSRPLHPCLPEDTVERAAWQASSRWYPEP
jgi:hypothetical protein